jgi:pullulanase
MKRISCFLLYILLLQKTFSQYTVADYPPYSGTDLGLVYTPATSAFRIWSPPAEAAEIQLYKDGHTGEPFQTVALGSTGNGCWSVSLPGEHKGTFYTFRVKIKGQWSEAVPDPYAKAVGINGRRAMVVDLRDSDPPGWAADERSLAARPCLPTEAIIYELHVRDATIHETSGTRQKGKFAGLAETGTTYAGMNTGLSYFSKLGVTHIHLLPFYDFNSVDEGNPKTNQYNWGYDPLNYNAPEGSYSSDPADGNTRMRELKQLVAAFHQNGLRVVMDVVYNHTALTGKSNFDQLVPGYYYRQKKDGSFSDATACGNETASERPMMRKFMLESLIHWVKEYHIDGFRFDLMGVHDIETMNLISAELNKVKPGILLYGEGWTAAASPLPDSLRALKANAASLNGIAVFSDDLRDGIKGSVFKEKAKGFVSGDTGLSESVKFGIVAACHHPQVKYNKVNYSKNAFASSPANVISYCECHDNHILWDKLSLSNPGVPDADRKMMQRLALTIVLTSQGIPFLHAGSEFLRSKKGVENSYNSGDSINAIDWSLRNVNHDLVEHIQQLIRMRKAHPGFRMTRAEEVAAHIHFESATPAGTIAYTIDGAAVKDAWKKIRVSFNGTGTTKTLTLPPGNWKNALNAKDKIYQGSIGLVKHSALVLYQD